MVVQAVINEYIHPAVDISSHTWNDVCNMLGIFVPRNGMPRYYKKVFLLELYEKITVYHGLQSTFVNKHALGHLAYYYGDILRPVIANQAKNYIIPPFFTDVSFSLDSRRNILKTEHPAFKNPGNSLKRECGTISWCGSGSQCQVDLWPAADTVKCNKCHQNVHPQRASFYLSIFTCQRCRPVTLRQHWTQRKRTCMLLTHIEVEVIAMTVPHLDNQAALNTTSPVNTKPMQVQTTSTNAVVNEESTAMVEEPERPGAFENDGREDEELHDTRSAEALLRDQIGLLRNDPEPIPAVQEEDKDNLDFNTRWDLVFTLPNTREATDELTLLSMINEFINALQLTDVSAVVVPWYNWSQSGKLNMETLQPNLEAIQIYFPRARINLENVKVYTDVRIAHSIPRASLEIGIRTWFINNNSSLYYKKLQVENTRVIGWFMWSHRFIKADLLSHVLAENHNIHGFFGFSLIYLGKGEKFGPKEGTKALFFVCEAKDFVEVTAELRVLYHQGQANFPLGIRLRFMPQIQNIDENLLLKMQIFWVQQFDFNAHIKTAGTADIQLLDAPIKGEKPLRNYIMNLKHNSSKDPLFLSVDNQWNDPSRCVFAFVVSHEKEAIRMVNTLAAHMLKKNPDRVRACFTPKAPELAATFLWDDTRKCYMTPEESYYLEMDIWGKDTELMGVNKNLVEQAIAAEKNVKLLEIMKEKPAARIERLYNGTDACSVGTVASKLHSKQITGVIDSDTDAASAGGDSISTTATAKSQRKAQDTKMILFEANMLETQRTLADMTKLLEILTAQVQGKAAATPPDTNRHTITINDSSAESKAAPRAGGRRVSAVGENETRASRVD